MCDAVAQQQSEKKQKPTGMGDAVAQQQSEKKQKPAGMGFYGPCTAWRNEVGGSVGHAL